MSTLESVIWHVLGYSAMPFIFLMGFLGVCVASIYILKVCGAKPVEAQK
ncbi:TIGR02808 family protein [Motilimonas pumila]|uniref:TIGR02808 family protein n=1 Tax=Motilimonas pumila TaxID=2303987 RepID=A0A418YGC5_9GAMM|nr:TIGR02808 family protein [Motilimonas pumila]RJG48681.1 TIGR02808 family protein [Motilimonas pumila]